MGGEDETVDFESLKETRVFWNIDDYPIPVDARDDLDPVFGDISKALDLMGFRDMTVWLYSEQPNYDKTDLCDAEVISTYLPEGTSATHFKVPDIGLYMIRCATDFGPGPVNFLVIAKPKRELHRVLQCLKSRRHNVLIVKPPPPGEEFLFSVDSLLENTRFLGGGKPRYKELYSHYAEEYDTAFERYFKIKEDVSKTVDFSERIPTLRGARTAVFWDAVDCPFPSCFTPDEIYRSISSALVAKGYSAKKITIWAYLDDDCDKKGEGGDKTWASRIYFLPAGDKASRRIRMLNDMFLWERDSRSYTRSYESSLVLFADDFKGDAYYAHMLQELHDKRRYDLIFVTPTPDINNPETPQWPGLLLDKGASWFADEPNVAEEETPESEKLPITSDMDYSGFGDQTSESSEDAEAEEDMNQSERRECPLASLVEEGPAWEDGAVEETPEDCKLYRWDPVIQMYKLKRLFPKMHEADAAAEQ